MPVARTSKPRLSLHRCLGIAIIAASCAITVAACGSSTPSAASARNAASSPQFALARCMRAHRVPNFPDPTLGAGGEGFSVKQPLDSSALTVDGISFSGPAFELAAKACQFGGALSPSAGISDTKEEGFIAKARCIRTHGVPNFPDPFFGPGGHGVGINLPPGLDPQSPAFRRATKACALIGAPIPGVG